MKTEIITPSTPNYVQVRLGRNKEVVTISVKDLNEEDLVEIGKKWTADLVAKARRP